MIFIERNRTVYDTEALQTFFRVLCEALKLEEEHTVDVRYGGPWDASYYDGKRHISRKRWVGSAATSDNLLIAPVSELPDSEPLHALASAADGLFLPVRVRKDLVEWALTCHETRYWSRWNKNNRPDHGKAKWAWDVVRDIAIPITDRIRDPYRRLTQQQQIERLTELYGAGGELAGVGWGYRKGHRSGTWQWHGRVEDARAYYENERDARMEYGAKLKKLGVEVEPYETFPEYLRRMADLFEKGKNQ